jgi:argininosuccinate synthase
VREAFARDYILPALQAGALYEDRYPLSTALTRPLIAKTLVDIARMEGARTIAHGCNGKANDELRLEIGVRALGEGIEVLAPARIWGMSRAEEIEYARARRITIPAGGEGPYTVDTNLWGRSIERGTLDDVWRESPEDIYTLTRSPHDCPDEPAYVEIEFAEGVPVKANGIEMSLLELIESVETIAGAHGVGRIDMVENAASGAKSREIYEAPAAVVLHTAHSELEKLVVPRELERLGHDLGRAYADLVYTGRWFSPTREAIDAFMRAIQPHITGTVRLKLFKGDCRVVGRRSPRAVGGGEAVSTSTPQGSAPADTIH